MLNDKLIKLFMKKPHIFGHYLGYPDLIGMHSEWINDAWINHSVEAIQAHRNSYKTSSILIVGAVWYTIFYDPHVTCLFIRKSEKVALKLGLAIQAHYESKNVQCISDYIYGVTELKTKRWSSSSMKISISKDISPEGTIDVIGMGGSVTGSHYDKIFPDDIITLKDRISKAEREYTAEYVRELRTNIVKEEGDIFFSGTPWHKDDAWTVIPAPKMYPIGTVPIRGYTPEVLEKKKEDLRSKTTSSLYAANYDLKHIANEDAIFENPVYLPWPKDINVQAWIDPAYSGDNTTSLTLVGKKENQWHGRGWVFQENIVDIYQRLANLLKEYRAGTLYIESNADKGLSAKDMRQLHPIVKPINESLNKHVKIWSYGKHHFHEIAWATDCQPEYMSQILDYQEGEEPDDAPDGFAALLRQLGFSGHKLQEMTAPTISISDLGM